MMRTQEVESAGRAPGLRAYRVCGDGSRSSHGDAAEQEVDQNPFPARRSFFDDPTSLVGSFRLVGSMNQNPRLDQEARGEQETHQLREQVKKLEQRLERLEIEKKQGGARGPEETTEDMVEKETGRVFEGMQRALVPNVKPYKNKDGTVEYPPWKNSTASSSLDVGAVIQQRVGQWVGHSPQMVVGGPPCSGWTEEVKKEKLSEEIKNTPRSRDSFQFRPTGAERWDICGRPPYAWDEKVRAFFRWRENSVIGSKHRLKPGIVSNQSSWPSLQAGSDSVSFCIKLLAP